MKMLECAQSLAEGRSLGTGHVPSGGAGPVLADDGEKEVQRYRAMNDMTRWRTQLSSMSIAARRCGRRRAAPIRFRSRRAISAKAQASSRAPMQSCRAISTDGDRVLDLEQRLLWCMEKSRPSIRRTSFRASSVDPARPRIWRISSPTLPISRAVCRSRRRSRTRKRKRCTRSARLFLRPRLRRGFSCATCHGDDGKRIRLQALPNLTKAGKDAQETMGSWPTYRVSQSAMRTMQHRLWDCYRQARMPPPEYLSDGITALTVYLTKQADGGVLTVPSIKR